MNEDITINQTENYFQIQLNPNIYDINVVKRVSYIFSDSCFVDIGAESPEIIKVIMRFKSGYSGDLSKISEEFKNRILEQQIRCELEKSFGHIREMIVKQAFAPTER